MTHFSHFLTQRSINGVRLSQRILELIPCVEAFRLVLKAVKKWAIVSGVQSNVLGFLGGINWAILVAWICIHHPKCTDPSRLLYIFFSTFARWKWPEPVMLEPPCSEPPLGVIRLPSWDPDTNPRDGLHLMPILTATYPTMNSAYNVGIPQLRRIQDEMWRACFLLESTNFEWAEIFHGCDFFSRHKNFIQIIMSAISEYDLMLWSRLCETKLRMLINELETEEVQPWPFAKFFERPDNHPVGSDPAEVRRETYFFVALRFAPGVVCVDLRSSMTNFLNRVNSWEGRHAGMDLKISKITVDALPPFIIESSTAQRPLLSPLRKEPASQTDPHWQPKRQKVS